MPCAEGNFKRIHGVYSPGAQWKRLALNGERQVVHAERDGFGVGADQFARRIGEARERALRAAQVGRAHGGEQPAVEFIRGKRNGHAQDGARHRIAPEDLPERFALTAHLHRLAQHLGGREFRRIGAKIAIQEVEDIVFGRIHARGKRGPRDRRQGGEGGAQPRVSAHFFQAREIGQFSFSHQAFGHSGIESIEAQQDGLFY